MSRDLLPSSDVGFSQTSDMLIPPSSPPPSSNVGVTGVDNLVLNTDIATGRLLASEDVPTTQPVQRARRPAALTSDIHKVVDTTAEQVRENFLAFLNK
jgi:hypothetical protein